jgi:hypothetical protein
LPDSGPDPRRLLLRDSAVTNPAVAAAPSPAAFDLEAIGMQLAHTDPIKLARAQQRLQAEVAPSGPPRERPNLPAVEESDLVQVETRRPVAP